MRAVLCVCLRRTRVRLRLIHIQMKTMLLLLMRCTWDSRRGTKRRLDFGAIVRIIVVVVVVGLKLARPTHNRYIANKYAQGLSHTEHTHTHASLACLSLVRACVQETIFGTHPHRGSLAVP